MLALNLIVLLLSSKYGQFSFRYHYLRSLAILVLVTLWPRTSNPDSVKLRLLFAFSPAFAPAFAFFVL